mmetsp:Transcript_12493/g.34681  ORF Transcript_12493/g.34681 Transcript_12493/m.34681 type:complete len:142 (+) Transcript_12493:326-751(+)
METMFELPAPSDDGNDVSNQSSNQSSHEHKTPMGKKKPATKEAANKGRKKGTARAKQTPQQKAAKAKESAKLPPFLESFEFDDIKKLVCIKRPSPLGIPPAEVAFVTGAIIGIDELDAAKDLGFPIMNYEEMDCYDLTHDT